MSTTAVVPALTRHRSVVDQLGRAIVKGSLGPALPVEDELAASLGVSRGALREAMRALTAKGLIEVRPRTGTRVRDPREWNRLDPDVIAWWWAADPDAVFGHVQQLRALLEPAAAAWAAERADPGTTAALRDAATRMVRGDDVLRADVDFHLGLLRMTGNPLLGSVGAALAAVFHPVFECTAAAGRGADAAALHLELADAVAAGDPAASREVAERLLEAARHDFAAVRGGLA